MAKVPISELVFLATGPISVLVLLASILCSFNAAYAHLDSVSEAVTNARLTRIEETLEKVCEKNNHLKKRVVALEQENEVLRELISNADKQKSDTTEKTRSHKPGSVRLKGHRKHEMIFIYQNASFMGEPTRTNSKLNAATVAFTAGLTPASINVVAGQKIVYDSVITNVGGAYNNETGLFTAPVRGVYAFNFAQLMEPGKLEYLEMVKDGIFVIGSHCNARGARHYASDSRTVTVEVEKDSEVWVQTPNKSWHEREKYGETNTRFAVAGFSQLPNK